MAVLDTYKIIKLPTRLTLSNSRINNVPVTPYPIVLNTEYNFIDLQYLFIDDYLGSHPVGVPLDSFIYQIRDDQGVWSDDIICTVNRDVGTGTPSITAKTINTDEQSGPDITNEFVFDVNTDRVLIDEVSGSGFLMVNGLHVTKDKEFMLYDFINILFIGGKKSILYDPVELIQSEIKLRVGNKNQYGAQTTFPIIFNDSAYLDDNEVIRDPSLHYQEFYKEFTIKNGIPNTTAKIRITPAISVSSFLLNANGTVIPLLLNSLTEVDVILNSEGRAVVSLTGVIPLTNPTDSYAFNVDVLLLKVNNSVLNVNIGNNHLIYSILSPDISEASTSIIENISLITSLPIYPPVLNDIIVNPDTGASIDILAVINKVPTLGQEPFTYGVVQDVNDAGVTITQQTNPNEFLITGVNASLSDFAGGKTFTAKITDASGVVSTKPFSIRETEVATNGLTPAITSSATLNPVVTAGFFINDILYEIVSIGSTDFTAIGASANTVGLIFRSTGIGAGTGTAKLIIEEGEFISYQITASNSPTSFRVENLPTGLSISPTGLITGSISTNGSYNINLFASNANGESTPAVVLTITVASALPVITNALTLNANSTDLISFQLSATGNPTSFSATGLPTGLSLNTSTGLITGITSVLGYTSVTITATNATGTSASKTLSIHITTLVQKPIISSSLSISKAIGENIGYAITASNNPTSYNAWGLPSGLSFFANKVNGSLAVAGVYSFYISATNSGGTDTKTVSLTINSYNI